MSETHIVADATGVRVMADKCKTCIFRPGNIMQLRKGRVRDMVDAAVADEGVIPCHDTLDDAKAAICRGFYDRYADGNWMLRLAKHHGVIVQWKRESNG